MKLVEQGKITHQQLKVLIAGIAAFVVNAKIVYLTEKVTACRDPEDDMLHDCKSRGSDTAIRICSKQRTYPLL